MDTSRGAQRERSNSMKLFEINNEIESLIDMETGEILDEDKLHKLQIDRHEKLRNIAFVYLNAVSDSKELDEQVKKFTARRNAAKATAEWAKATLARELEGKEMKEAEFKISYRKSKSVEIANADDVPLAYHIPQADKIDKASILALLKAGESVPGAELIEKSNIQIK